MPIYEFTCLDCRQQFEELCAMGCNSVPCPKCASHNTQKRISVFSAKSISSEGIQPIGGSHSCGTCHGGSCATCH